MPCSPENPVKVKQIRHWLLRVDATSADEMVSAAACDCRLRAWTSGRMSDLNHGFASGAPSAMRRICFRSTPGLRARWQNPSLRQCFLWARSRGHTNRRRVFAYEPRSAAGIHGVPWPHYEGPLARWPGLISVCDALCTLSPRDIEPRARCAEWSRKNRVMTKHRKPAVVLVGAAEHARLRWHRLAISIGLWLG